MVPLAIESCGGCRESELNSKKSDDENGIDMFWPDVRGRVHRLQRSKDAGQEKEKRTDESDGEMARQHAQFVARFFEYEEGPGSARPIEGS